MSLAHKIALDPNGVQETHFRKAVGTARFAYKYAARPSDPTWPKPSAVRWRQLHAVKADPCPWMLDVPKNAVQRAIIHWGPALPNVFAGIAEYPTFKKNGHHDSFPLTNDQCTVQGRKVHIPKLRWVRPHEAVRFVGNGLSGTISRTDRWLLRIPVEIPDPPIVSPKNHVVVGVELGVAALSTGETIAGPKASGKNSAGYRNSSVGRWKPPKSAPG